MDRSYKRVAFALLVAASCGYTQDAPTRFFTVNCVDVALGKSAEYLELNRDNRRPVEQARADQGRILAWFITESVYPAGKAADCQYQQVTVFLGFPGEAPAQTNAEAEWARVKTPLTYGQFLAKRNAIASLAKSELWEVTSNLGRAGQGDYLAVTYQSRTGIPTYKKQVLERMQPVHEVQIKEGKKLSEWMSATLYAPRGSGQFNVLELHAYTDFAGIHASGITPIQTLLNRQFGLSLSEIFSPPEASKTEIRRIVQLVRPSRATPSGAGGF